MDDFDENLRPLVIDKKIINNDLFLTLQVSEKLKYFQGHFKDFPILPGVVQLDWVIYFVKSILKLDGEFNAIDVIKFKEPLFPNTEVNLSIKVFKEKNKIEFLFNNENSTFSSGKIKWNFNETI